MAVDRDIRVLVVACSHTRCKSITNAVRKGGLKVIAARECATEGLRYAKTHRPDAILVDLGLAHSGLLRMVENIMRSSPIPVLLLSKLTDDEVPATVEALSLGAVDVIAEPGTVTPSGHRQAPEELVGAIRMAVRKFHSKGWLNAATSSYTVSESSARSLVSVSM